MTLGELKGLTSVFLIGDYELPSEEDKVINMLKAAYMELSDITTPLKWLEKSHDMNILKQGPGDYWVRMPELPNDVNDTLDIDSELVPAVARLMASYLAQDQKARQEHRFIAKTSLERYGSKVRAFINRGAAEGKYGEEYSRV